MKKWETHCHTSDIDPVSRLSPIEMVNAYKEKGYSGIVITNHYFKELYEWYPELREQDKSVFLDKYLFGYRQAKEYGQKIGMQVLLGAEVRFDGFIDDFLIYGITEDFIRSAPLLNELNLDELRNILPKEAVIFQAHPFRNRMEITDPKKLFGVEVYNGRTAGDRNKIAQIWAETENLKMISGSDCHTPDDVAKGGICVSDDILCEQDFARLLISCNYTLILT